MPEVQLSAGTIDFEDTGGEGPAIVFVHGLMMDGSLWHDVVEDLRSDYRCVLPTLPLGAQRQAMNPDADLSMRGVAALLGEFIERLELRDVTLAMNDWGGPQLLIGSPQQHLIARLVICACEAFDNVPPKGSARALPYIARVPGGIAAAVAPFRFDRLRRLGVTYGVLSKRPVSRTMMDRWFGPVLSQRAVRRDLAKYVRGASEGRRELIAIAEQLGSFDRPALVVWAKEDRIMPAEHGRRLAQLLPNSQLLEIEDSRTLVPIDQPKLLAGHLRDFMRSSEGPGAAAGS
jgi:pimeloyl-ACP methyl ester carboxylesterase